MRRSVAAGGALWAVRALTFAATMAPALAWSQEAQPSASDIALARSLASEGVQMADAGGCAGAIEKLQRAETLYHAPTILGRLGECQVNVGKLVAGTENLQRVVRESLGPRAPKAFVDAQARAQKVLDTALPKVGKLRIHVDVPVGVRLDVKVDGEPVSAAALDVDRPADPGTHQIKVTAPGYRTVETQQVVTQGGSAKVALKLEVDPAAPVESAAALPPPTPAVTPPERSSPVTYQAGADPKAASSKGGNKTLSYVLLGVGGAGIAVGSIFGGVALGKRSSLNENCKPTKSDCRPDSQDDIDGMKSAATISTVSFAVGAAGLGAGLILLLTSKPSSSTGFEPKAAHVAVTPVVGPREIGLLGTF